MRTPLHKRDAPDGWQLADRVTDNWRVGWVFQWSEGYQNWLELPGNNRLTIKPGVYLAEALETWLSGWRETNARHDFDVFQPTEWA
jgi:hypothetical protein